MPRSSRSHSTLVPADSMIASTPHVTSPSASPGHDRERAGTAARVEAGARRCRCTTSSMPPVPKVILAGPGATHPGRSATPAGRRACPAIGGAPGERGGRGRARPTSRRSRAASTRGCAAASRTASSQPAPSGRGSPVTAALREVGDVERAVGQPPGDPGVDRAEAEVARAVGVVGVEQPGQLGGRLVRARSAGPRPASVRHSPIGAQVLPAERRADRLAAWRGPTRWSRPAGW